MRFFLFHPSVNVVCHTALSFAEHSMEASRLSAVE